MPITKVRERSFETVCNIHSSSLSFDVHCYFWYVQLLIFIILESQMYDSF